MSRSENEPCPNFYTDIDSAMPNPRTTSVRIKLFHRRATHIRVYSQLAHLAKITQHCCHDNTSHRLALSAPELAGVTY